jgi:hypothetical protein
MSKGRRSLKGSEIGGYFSQESLGWTWKGKGEEETSEDSKLTLN